MGHTDEMSFDRFSCKSVLKVSADALHQFTVREGGGFLAEYLKSYSLRDEKDNYARTYVIEDTTTNEISGYFSLKAGFVAANETHALFHRAFDSVPGIELANFAVNESYRKRHKNIPGFGAYMLDEWIIPKAKEAQAIIGLRVLYIFALNNPTLIRMYEQRGFHRLPPYQEWIMHKRIRPRYDQGCVFMYQIL